MRTKLIIAFCTGLLLVGFYLVEEQRLARVLDEQKMEQGQISAKYRKALEKIREDLENGFLTYEEAVDLMLEEHKMVQEENVEIFERTVDEIVPAE